MPDRCRKILHMPDYFFCHTEVILWSRYIWGFAGVVLGDIHSPLPLDKQSVWALLSFVQKHFSPTCLPCGWLPVAFAHNSSVCLVVSLHRTPGYLWKNGYYTVNSFKSIKETYFNTDTNLNQINNGTIIQYIRITPFNLWL